MGCNTECQNLWSKEQQLTQTTGNVPEINKQIRLLRAAAHTSNFNSLCSMFGSNLYLRPDSKITVLLKTVGDYWGNGAAQAKSKIVTFQLPSYNDSPSWDDANWRLVCTEAGPNITPGGAPFTLTDKSFVFYYTAGSQTWWAINLSHMLYTLSPTGMNMIMTTGAGWGSYSDNIGVFWLGQNNFKQLGLRTVNENYVFYIVL